LNSTNFVAATTRCTFQVPAWTIWHFTGAASIHPASARKLKQGFLTQAQRDWQLIGLKTISHPLETKTARKSDSLALAAGLDCD
jgi:hypothetical protein